MNICLSLGNSFEGMFAYAHAGFPKSPIRFDPDRLEEFSETEEVTYSDLSVEYKVALSYVRELSYPKIAKELEIHKEEVRRAIKKVLNAWIKSQKIDVVKEEIAGAEEEPSKIDSSVTRHEDMRED